MKKEIRMLSLIGKTLKILGSKDEILPTDYMYMPYYDTEYYCGPGTHYEQGVAYLTKYYLSGWIGKTLTDYRNFRGRLSGKEDFIVFRIIE